MIAKKRVAYIACLLWMICFIVGCGFHLQGQMHLAPPLQKMYLQSPDPYGHLARNLQQYLKMSKVQLTATPAEADTILVILQDTTAQSLLSVSGTQQTRQYNLQVTVVFEITDKRGCVLIAPQVLTETRTITIQSNQILGSSNEANLYYQQMRRFLAYAILNRLATQEIARALQ